MSTCLFIFRRDLRLNDNIGLINALKDHDNVIPLFIFSENQISNKNLLKSSNCIQFMIESLYDLDLQIKKANSKASLWVDYGDEIKIIQKVHNVHKFDSIYFNKDYSPYSLSRDKKIESWCKTKKINFESFHDLLLVGEEVNNIFAKNGNVYYVYNLFYKKALSLGVDKQMKNNHKNYLAKKNDYTKKNIDKFNKEFISKGFYEINNNLAVRGGTKNGNKILLDIKKNKFKNYDERKNMLNMKTTMLSAHNKFGTISIRHEYEIFGVDKTGEMRKSLYWRDFYYYLSIHDKDFYKYIHLTKDHTKNYNLWNHNAKFLKLWKEGNTGYPIIDAAMTEMNETGFMHNRARMIVAEFLTKILLIDWKYGEKYFTTKLVDIDRAQNMGNWNWCSSFGLDASPYLRIFNTWTQSKNFDPNCEYIKKWLPELKNIPNNHLHNWFKHYQNYNIYLEPIVDYSVQREIFIKKYKKSFK